MTFVTKFIILEIVHTGEEEQMQRLIDQGILYVAGLLLLGGTAGWVRPVLAALFALIYVSVSNYVRGSRGRLCVAMMLTGICCFLPELLCFLPLVCYDIVWHCLERRRSVFAGVVVVVLIAAYALLRGGRTMGSGLIWLGFLMVLAGVGAYRTRHQLQQKEAYIHLKDSSTELRMVMQRRQQELMEKQDYEIHLATLQERNRIAREIHDNVGHMLSRGILQMGALQTIHREEPLHGQLGQINDTLGDAMNSIRESVHDLHNESLDLRQAMYELCREFESEYHVELHYDMTQEIPRTVKYCFLAVIREAFANVVRHSDADKVSVFVCEHPGFYQMSVDDNGTTDSLPDTAGTGEGGIGLANMTDRVQALGGSIHFRAHNGFHIMISIPKQKP